MRGHSESPGACPRLRRELIIHSPSPKSPAEVRSMKRLLFSCALVLLPAIVTAADPAGVRSQLFDGKSLEGWVVSGCEVEVKEGVLRAKGGNGLVRTENRYRDFVLELDYRALQKEKYDAGIYIRCEPAPEGRPFPTQYQVNLKQGDELNLIRFPKAKSTGLVKPNEWNHVKLTVVGDRCSAEINGQAAWETDGIKERDGYVGLQVEVPLGGQFEYKNIAITELDYKPLFDGTSLAGWEGAGQPA